MTLLELLSLRRVMLMGMDSPMYWSAPMKTMMGVPVPERHIYLSRHEDRASPRLFMAGCSRSERRWFLPHEAVTVPVIVPATRPIPEFKPGWFFGPRERPGGARKPLQTQPLWTQRL